MSRSDNRWLRTKDLSGDAYDARYDERAAAGENVHGEADFVMRHAPRSVLDAGCGTGRVARELARRGVDVVGVDLDPDMLATARRRSPELRWVEADLASFQLGRTFDAVVAAGNVMILLTPGSEPAVLANIARHLRPDGLLIAGFQVRPEHLTLAEYERAAAGAGFRLVERFATWDREPWTAEGRYVVSVHSSAGSPHGDDFVRRKRARPARRLCGCRTSEPTYAFPARAGPKAGKRVNAACAY
jgi:SAM-dependent methyltransferase